jgi:isopentenyldiphosphate isomerase
LGKIYFEEGTLNEVTLAQFATVYIIKYEDQPIIIDTDEISEGKWMSLDEIEVMIKAEPEKLSIGFLNVWKQFKQLIVNFS